MRAQFSRLGPAVVKSCKTSTAHAGPCRYAFPLASARANPRSLASTAAPAPVAFFKSGLGAKRQSGVAPQSMVKLALWNQKEPVWLLSIPHWRKLMQWRRKPARAIQSGASCRARFGKASAVAACWSNQLFASVIRSPFRFAGKEAIRLAAVRQRYLALARPLLLR